MHCGPLKTPWPCACFWPMLSCAGENYAATTLPPSVIDELVAEEGFEREAGRRVQRQPAPGQSIIEAMNRPAEKTKAWYEYRRIFLNDKRDRAGRGLLPGAPETLPAPRRNTGVPAEIIVAIIGVETYYGRITWQLPRDRCAVHAGLRLPAPLRVFTSELKHYLILTRDQGMDPLEPGRLLRRRHGLRPVHAQQLPQLRGRLRR